MNKSFVCIIIALLCAISAAVLLPKANCEELAKPASPAALDIKAPEPAVDETVKPVDASTRTLSGSDLTEIKKLASEQTTIWHRIWALFGLLGLLGITYLLSENRKAIDKKLVFWGMVLQMGLAIFILQTSFGQWIFSGIAKGIQRLLDFSAAGSDFVFGRWPDVMGVKDVVTGKDWVLGYNFAVKVFPTIIFVSSLFAVLYHLGVLQKVVDLMAKGMQKLMRLSGAESLCTVANIFMGMTAAPLMIEPYVAKLTKSEFMVLMVGGMATIGTGVMVAYIGMGIDATHILTASFISAPAALVTAKIMIPETTKPLTMGRAVKVKLKKNVNVFDAAASGASEGMTLSINIAAMLIAFLALIALINALLAALGDGLGFAISNGSYSISALSFMLDNTGNVPLSLESILGVIGAPIALMIGISPSEILQVGSLIGIKTAANEFIAYSELSKLIQTGALSPRGVVLSTYALCGFANFGSLAVMLGGVGGIAPSRRGDIARLGIRSIIGGSIASFLTATVAGILL